MRQSGETKDCKKRELDAERAMQALDVQLTEEAVGHKHLQLSQQVCANSWCRAVFKPKMCEKNGVCRLFLRCNECCARNADAQRRYIHTRRGRYFRKTWEQTARAINRKRDSWSSRQAAEGVLGEKDSLVSTATFNSACTSLADDLGCVGDVEGVHGEEEVQSVNDAEDSRYLEDRESAPGAEDFADVEHVQKGNTVHGTESGQGQHTPPALLAAAPASRDQSSVPDSGCESTLESTLTLWPFFQDYIPYF